MRAQFITAEEVQQILSVSRSKSYQIIRDLNKELKSMGYHTIAGKCPIQFFSGGEVSIPWSRYCEGGDYGEFSGGC